MKFCQKCGKELNDDAVICIGCGCAVPTAKESAPTHTSTQTPAAESASYSSDSAASDGLGITSIVLGAIGIPFSLLLAITGYFFGGAGLALAIISSKKNPFSNKGKVGLILSIITLTCAFVNSLMGFFLGLLMAL